MIYRIDLILPIFLFGSVKIGNFGGNFEKN